MKLISIDIEVIDNKFGEGGFWGSNKFYGKTAFLYKLTEFPGSPFYHGAVFIYEDGNWTKLPDTIKVGSEKFPMPITPSSSINFDSAGNVWVSGNHLYKYSDGKWQFFYLNDSDLAWRRYNHFCIDKFNNIWVGTQVIHDTLAHYSELLKFDGTKFETVLKFNHPYSFLRLGSGKRSNGISALPDGRIAVYRILQSIDEDVQKGKTEDLYFFNQDLTYIRLKLQTPSGSDFNEHMKIVSSIFPETDGKIWFCLDYHTLTDEYQTTCCSGLELLENNTWTAFDEKYGFETIKVNPKPVVKAIYLMKNLDKDNYLLLSDRCLYKFRKDYHLEKIRWLDIVNTPCKYLKAKSHLNDTLLLLYLSELWNEKPTSNFGGQEDIHFQENGEVWLQLADGILIFNKSVLTDVVDNTEDNSLSLFPVPARESIKFLSTIDFTDYKIMNILGEILKQGTNYDNRIDISDMPDGIYFIKLWGHKQESQIYKFIKINY